MKLYDLRLEAINELLDTIANTLGGNYVISKDAVKHEALRITMRIKGSHQITVKWIPIDPDMNWDFQRWAIEDEINDAFIKMHNGMIEEKR